MVHNGVDLARLRRHRPRTEVRRELGLAPEAVVVGLVARLDHWGKGHREFFTALAALPDGYPVEALIIGGGRREAEMRRLAAELGLAGRVHFLGQRDDVPDLLSALDLFVLPSHSEGVSLALLEAMAAGLPVIATAVGGLPEVVTDGENGLLIPPRTRRPWPRPWPGSWLTRIWPKNWEKTPAATWKRISPWTAWAGRLMRFTPS